MQYNTKDIIKIIPLEPAYKEQLLAEYDTYDDSKKYEISAVCWATFTELTDKLADMKYKEFMEEVVLGKRKLTTNMMGDAYSAVHKEYEDVMTGKKQEVQQIDEIRNKLQTWLSNQPKDPTK